MKRFTIHIGGFHASRTPVVVETVLGSCVAACIFDPVSHIGGMNHFLLPWSCEDDPFPTRYGSHAMDTLIARILRLGADRSRLEAKVFGAVSVLDLDEQVVSVPRANAEFVREYLAAESIPISAHRLGGRQPLKVRLWTETGRVEVRTVSTPARDGVREQPRKGGSENRWRWLEEAKPGALQE